MKNLLLTALLIASVSFSASAQKANKETATPTVKLQPSAPNKTRLNEAEYIKAKKALQATLVKQQAFIYDATHTAGLLAHKIAYQARHAVPAPTASN
jgi:hypothetical protein